MPMPSDTAADREDIVPDPQLDKRQRRRFTAEQKRRILDEVDACTEHGLPIAANCEPFRRDQ